MQRNASINVEGMMGFHLFGIMTEFVNIEHSRNLVAIYMV